MHFKITFHLDGSGLMYDPNEPIHLDALLAWALAPRQGVHQHLMRDDVPAHVGIPLVRQRVAGGSVWRASALLPEGPTGEGVQYWRKRFRSSRADISTGAPNLTNGTYRDWNMPIPLFLCQKLTAWASGSRKECKRVLRDVQYLGKKRAHGHGKVTAMDFDECGEDWSLSRDGFAQRWLPDEDGTRLVRLAPPYWNAHDRVRCCEVGDATRVA